MNLNYGGDVMIMVMMKAVIRIAIILFILDMTFLISNILSAFIPILIFMLVYTMKLDFL